MKRKMLLVLAIGVWGLVLGVCPPAHAATKFATDHWTVEAACIGETVELEVFTMIQTCADGAIQITRVVNGIGVDSGTEYTGHFQFRAVQKKDSSSFREFYRWRLTNDDGDSFFVTENVRGYINPEFPFDIILEPIFVHTNCD